MGPEQWQQLKQLYAAVEECPIQERTALLHQVEAEDPEMGAQLRALLAHRAPTDDFLEHPVARVVGPPTLQAIGNSLTHPIQDLAWPRELLELGELLVGRFRIIRFIASGGMGDVYEAEDTQLGERIALKTIRTEVAASPRMLARFKKEIQLAKRISHPNRSRTSRTPARHAPERVCRSA